MNFLTAICMIFYRPKKITATASENPKKLPVVITEVLDGWTTASIMNAEEIFKDVPWKEASSGCGVRKTYAWLPKQHPIWISMSPVIYCYGVVEVIQYSDKQGCPYNITLKKTNESIKETLNFTNYG